MRRTVIQPKTPEEWVQYCIAAAAKAYTTAIKNPPEVASGAIYKLLQKEDERQGIVSPPDYLEGEELKQHASQWATIAFLAAMPLVTTRANTRAYIACVAAGVQRKYIAGVEARALLYTCQLALAAGRKTRA